jgi:hypothetical protein
LHEWLRTSAGSSSSSSSSSSEPCKPGTPLPSPPRLQLKDGAQHVDLSSYGDVVGQPFWFPSSSLQLRMVATAGRYLALLNQVGSGADPTASVAVSAGLAACVACSCADAGRSLSSCRGALLLTPRREVGGGEAGGAGGEEAGGAGGEAGGPRQQQPRRRPSCGTRARFTTPTCSPGPWPERPACAWSWRGGEGGGQQVGAGGLLLVSGRATLHPCLRFRPLHAAAAGRRWGGWLG